MDTGTKLPPETFTPDEANALLRACSRRYSTGIRNAALIVVLWRAGLRIHEALALKPKDLDLERGTIRVLHGKGDVDRTVGLDPEACAMLTRWIERRASLGATARHALFCQITRGRIGRPISSSYIRHALPRLAAKAGVEKRVHAHGFRHTMASELLREGAALDVIQAQLGHARPSTTDRYLRRIAPERLVESMRSRPAWTAEPVVAPIKPRSKA
jgi:integrase/recombinase XerD